MPHVDADTLALLALGEDVATGEERAHLDACPECRARIAELADAAAVGRTVLGLERLTPPPARVWAGIAAELDLPAELAATATSTTSTSTRVLEVPAEPGEQQPTGRRPRRRRLILALAAVVALLAVGVAGAVAIHRAGEPRVIAHARLAPLPGWSGTNGTAEIEQYRDGRRLVVVSTNIPPTGSDGHEVWLMDAATGARIGLGFLRGRSGTFVVPSTADLAAYSYIDVSAEPHDGNPAPSGKSIVRGALGS